MEVALHPGPLREDRELNVPYGGGVPLRPWLRIPSAGVSTRRRVRLLALLAVRDEMRFLPGFLTSVGPHVDGIVALDDGSTDGSGELLAGRPEVLRCSRTLPVAPGTSPPTTARSSRRGRARRGLASRWTPTSASSGTSGPAPSGSSGAAVVRPPGVLDHSARGLGRARHLARRRPVGPEDRARLFRALPDHRFDERALHAHKAPLQGRAAVATRPPTS